MGQHNELTNKECFECDYKHSLHKHHVVPKIKGGKRTIWLCEKCHGKVHGLDFLNHKELTKLGLKKAKENGVTLGTPKNLTYEARKKGGIARKEKALKNKNNIKSTIEILKLKKTKLSYEKIASELTKKGFLTSGNKNHNGRSVQLLYIRAKNINNGKER